MDDDKAGIAPDAVPALFLGRFGARELEVRYDDVGYVADRALMATLFPRLDRRPLGARSERRGPVRTLRPWPRPSERLPEGEAKAKAVRGMFDAIAPRYDLVNRVMTFGLDRSWRRTTVAALGLARRLARCSTSPPGPATCAPRPRPRA